MVWVGERQLEEKKRSGPFTGCLIILNMDKIESRKNSAPEYFDDLLGAIANAHADGLAIVYLYEEGIVLPSDDVEQIDGMDFHRLFGIVCKDQACDFSSDPDERVRQFSVVAKAVLSQKEFVFEGHRACIVGSCKIDGQNVLLPMLDLRGNV